MDNLIRTPSVPEVMGGRRIKRCAAVYYTDRMAWTGVLLIAAAIGGVFFLGRMPYLTVRGVSILYPMHLFGLAMTLILLAFIAVFVTSACRSGRLRKSLVNPLFWATCITVLAISDKSRGYPVSIQNSISRSVPLDRACDLSETLVETGGPNAGTVLLMEQLHLTSDRDPPFQIRLPIGLYQACIGMELAKRDVRVIFLEDLSLDPRSFGALFDVRAQPFSENIPARLSEFLPAQVVDISQSAVFAYHKIVRHVEVHSGGGTEAFGRFQRILQLNVQIASTVEEAKRTSLEAERERLVFEEREKDAVEQVALHWDLDPEPKLAALIYGADHHFPAELFEHEFQRKPTVKRLSWVNSPAMSGHRIYLERNPKKELAIIRSAVAIPYYDLQNIDSLEGRLMALPKVLSAAETYPEKWEFEHELRTAAIKGLDQVVGKDAAPDGISRISAFVSRQAERCDGPFRPYCYEPLSGEERSGTLSTEAIVKERNPVRQLRLIESARQIEYPGFVFAASREAQRAVLPKLKLDTESKWAALEWMNSHAFDAAIREEIAEMARSNSGPFAIFR